jgi:two-component system heavy metal sensor histidine kinase CusS
MAHSLGRTLATRFALTMGVALVAIALWTYRGVTVILREQLDRSLQATYEIQAGALAADGSIVPLSAVDERWFVEEVNRLVVGWDATGRIAQVNVGLARDLALDSAAFRRAMAGGRTSAEGKRRGREIRMLYGPAPSGAGGVAVIGIAAFVAPIEAAARQVLLRMSFVALLGAFASLVGAMWLTRSALEPVETIARQAGAIHGGRTGQRITAHAEVIELRGLIQILNEMLARLEQSYEWHRRIIRDLGHDLRTPIATMRACAEMALSTERRPEQYRQALASTLEEVDRLTLISDALSLLARLESGDLKPLLVRTDVRAVARQAVDRARERVGGHEIRFLSPPEPLPATLDGRLLGMVLDQLLDNARRHTPPGTRVDLTVAAGDGRVRMTVEDEGPGVPEEVMAQLFKHFYRGDPARGRQAGLGLGLTLAAAIVELHQGRITAERRSPQGLRIRIELPRDGLVEPGSKGHQAQPQQDPSDLPQ